VNDIFRYAMYYENYGQQRTAMEAYAKIPVSRNASQCVECNAPCEGSCPFGLPVKNHMRRFDRLLKFA
jgi:predicted aldo/keto reductase-like oxidoreductase